jgi:hypothetical protein
VLGNYRSNYITDIAEQNRFELKGEILGASEAESEHLHRSIIRDLVEKDRQEWARGKKEKRG